MPKSRIEAGDTRAHHRAIHAKALELIMDSKNNINLGFVDQRKHDVSKNTESSHNQIIVILEGGRYVLTPIGIDGERLKDYFGVRYKKIRYWSALPGRRCSLNPCMSKMSFSHETSRDIYERE